MDGYALLVAGTSHHEPIEVSQRIAAGHTGEALAAGTLARIFTGAPMPSGADAVVMQENTETTPDGKVRILQMPKPGENVRRCGHDIAAGTTILRTGDVLRPQELALAASVGKAALLVYEPLRVAILSTGDELVEPPAVPGPGQIYNANHYALVGLVKRLGMEVVDLGLVPDDPAATAQAVLRGAREADCIVSTGGVSVGEEDHVKAVIEEHGSIDFWRVAIRPGKPLAFGEVLGTPFFGLPGNPVSTFVTFTVFATPWLRRAQGRSDVFTPLVRARAGFSKAGGSRREYVRVRYTEDDAGEPVVTLFGNQDSSVMSSLSWANALAVVDIGQQVEPGDMLKIHLLDGC